MNKLVALSTVAAVPTIAPAMATGTDPRALHAYASWLFMERRILCGELWPHLGADAERYDWFDNAGAGWHMRGRGELAWDHGPQPSDRAAAVLDLVGVDWRQPREDLGLNHEDTGVRPPLPVGWPENPAADRPADPIFALIEAHKSALEQMAAATDEARRLMAKAEKKFGPWDQTDGRKRPAFVAYLDKISPTGDHDTIIDEAADRLGDATSELAETVPASMPGLLSMAAYAEHVIEHEATFDESDLRNMLLSMARAARGLISSNVAAA